ncbi:hypothetical protein [Echinicola sp. 20G]|uniref:hypothetical protein n=1 Tax=Echinicola sp. 20G TaxID=2781961 RepID=UPI001910405E|nr:hypothetical protein [Echinicola sp. 20G]
MKNQDSLLPLDRERSQRDYTGSFKFSVILKVEKGIMTYKQAQRIYGFQGRSTVLVYTYQQNPTFSIS